MVVLQVRRRSEEVGQLGGAVLDEARVRGGQLDEDQAPP
jgi:hypothetical protein